MSYRENDGKRFAALFPCGKSGLSGSVALTRVKCDVPSCHYFIHTLIPIFYEEEKAGLKGKAEIVNNSKIVEQLKDVPAFPITYDLWKALTNDSFFTVSIHWIDLQFHFNVCS